MRKLTFKQKYMRIKLSCWRHFENMSWTIKKQNTKCLS